MTAVHPQPSDEEYGLDRLAQTVSNYETHENHEMITKDHEDHTFSGIMFVVECLDNAIRNVVVRGVSVRGELGPMTVWVAPGAWDSPRGLRENLREDAARWTRCFEGFEVPSYRSLRRLDLHDPITLEPGEVVTLYVHSSRRGDCGIVYDNARGGSDCADGYLRVGAGCAHLVPVPFFGYHPWGAWRNRRAFVGRLDYGVRHLLWQPEKRVHGAFPAPFRDMVRTLLVLRNRRDNYVADLPEDVLYYILHMCSSSWAPPRRPRTPAAAALARRSSGAWASARAVRRTLLSLLGFRSKTRPPAPPRPSPAGTFPVVGDFRT